MNIYNHGASAMTIYIPTEELKSQGLTAEELTVDETADIVRKAVPEMDNYYSQMEVYPGNEEVLIFMFFSSCEPAFFGFKDIESVIAAAQCCRGEQSELYYDGDSYVLTVYPWRGGELPPALFEFGNQLNVPAEYRCYLNEHCKTIIKTSAIDFLSYIF